MATDNLEKILERIAVALENIAENMPTNHYTPSAASPPSSSVTDTPQNFSQQSVNTIEAIEKVANGNSSDIEASTRLGLFLNSKNIQIKFIPSEDSADEVINSLGTFIGDHYSSLRDILSRIKANMQRGGSITLPMKNFPQQDISYTCQLCTRLFDIAFLEQYKYMKSPHYLLRAKTTTLPAAQNFFSGKWLERYVVEVIKKTTLQVALELETEFTFDYLLNPQIILPNGDDFELDVLFHVNGYFYWVEAKTGDYQQHIQKYAKVAKMLELDDKHSMMVLTDISPDRSDTLTALFHMQVFDLTQLEQGLYNLIKADMLHYNQPSLLSAT